MRTLVIIPSSQQKRFYSNAITDAELIESNSDSKELISRIGTNNVTLIIPSYTDLT